MVRMGPPIFSAEFGHELKGNNPTVLRGLINHGFKPLNGMILQVFKKGMQRFWVGWLILSQNPYKFAVQVSITAKWNYRNRQFQSNVRLGVGMGFMPKSIQSINPRKLTCTLKRDYFSREYIFQPLIFR